MKISLNWLKRFVEIKIPDDELIRLIGARLVEVEGVINENEKYNNIYVVKVVKAEKIPDTHLTLCLIDVGGREIAKVEKNADGLVQVVCGAPNVREGMLSAWIAPGAIVPASVHEDAPFVIGKRKMLGKYESNGMLAGADELDFGDDHSGIVEINPDEAEAGDLLADVFSLNDLILEIENKSLTHRPDCFGMVGFAREVAGILGVRFDEENIFSSKVDFKKSGALNIEIKDEGICTRYSAVVLEKHGEMKKKYLTWQDTILAKSGMRPVEPIVDVTNYLMLLTGQPLHAFDFDKFVAVGGVGRPKIIVRLATDGEELTLLNEKKIILNHNDIVITSNNVPVALAGAMGGESTAIDKETRKIIIESATFSLYNLRKTQMEHGIFSEAITRFTKGQPPYQTMTVAKECAEMLSDGFEVEMVKDEYPHPEKINVVKITTDAVNQLLGTDYSDKLIQKTLENVGFEVKAKRGAMEVKAPEWRTDIHIAEDVIEEVGRLNGYDNIMPVLPLHATAKLDKMWTLKTRTRNILCGFGANEVLTYSFVSDRLLKKAGLLSDNSYKIINSISPELQLVRQSIVPSLLDKAYMNQKLPVDKFAIFEMNKVYRREWGMDEENVPVERTDLGFVLAERKGEGDAYYVAKNYIIKYLEELNIRADVLPIKNENVENLPFEKERAAEVWAEGEYLGVVGEFKNSVRRNYKLAEFLAGAELDMDAVLCLANAKKTIDVREIKKREDVTIATTKNYGDVLSDLQQKNPEAIISPVGIYQLAGTKEKKITFHLEWK